MVKGCCKSHTCGACIWVSQLPIATISKRFLKTENEFEMLIPLKLQAQKSLSSPGAIPCWYAFHPYTNQLGLICAEGGLHIAQKLIPRQLLKGNIAKQVGEAKSASPRDAAILIDDAAKVLLKYFSTNCVNSVAPILIRLPRLYKSASLANV